MARTSASLALFFAVVLVLCGFVSAGPFGWVEGESPSSATVEVRTPGVDRPQYLSGGKWLAITCDPGEQEKLIPEAGAVFTYRLAAGGGGGGGGGRRAVWARIGFEFARAPFEWRVNGGEWNKIAPETPTLDLMELSFFTEVAWIKLGEVDASPAAGGETVIDIRLPRHRNDKGEWQRVLFALDALCLADTAWHPFSKFKPDESPRTDADKAADDVVYELKAAAGRSSVELAGVWRIARDDESLPGPVAEPLKALPANPVYLAINVPGDKGTLRHDLGFAHRVWYHARLKVPAEAAGRSVFLDLPLASLNATVFVNGKAVAFNPVPLVPFRCDLTSAIKPGEINDIHIGIRDAWYGYKESPTNPLKLRRALSYPRELLGRGFQDLAYPVWNKPESGLLEAPIVTLAGAVYASDVYVDPSVARKSLGVEATVRNTTPRAASGRLKFSAVDPVSGKVEKEFAPVVFTVAANAEQVVRADFAWENPRLWWPDEPSMYELRATVEVAGADVDLQGTAFGFREWSIDGTRIRLNGVRYNARSDAFHQPTAEAVADFYKKTNQSTYRVRNAGVFWAGTRLDKFLSVMDRRGVVVRLEGILDGQAIGYHAMEQDPELRKRNGSNINVALLENTRAHMVANVRAHRNHPSMAFWTLDNEFFYINVDNLHRGDLPGFEKWAAGVQGEVKKVHRQAMVMWDGLGAGPNHVMDIHGDHYLFGDEREFGRFPSQAYNMPARGGKALWDGKRPRFSAEDFYASGINPFDFSYFGGEECFGGKTAIRPTVGLVFRMLAEGYRWHDMAAFQLFLGQDSATDQYGSFAPVAAFVKQWDWTLGSGQTVARDVKLFNDTHHADALTFTWTLTVAGTQVGSASSTHAVPPGENEAVRINLAAPVVSKRTEGELTLVVQHRGREAFREVKAVSVLPPPVVTATGLVVLDPEGSVVRFLEGLKVSHARIESLAALKDEGRVLVVGRDALSPADAVSTRLAAYAATGRRVVVLEQRSPLRYSGLGGAVVETDSNEGRIAFVEDASHPAVAGLSSKDFFTWSGGGGGGGGGGAGGGDGDQVVYRNAYLKPSRGARSLLQAGPRLTNSPLIEVPLADGLMLLAQLPIAEKLGSHATAQALFARLIDHASSYNLQTRDVRSLATGDAILNKALGEIALKRAPVSDVRAALADPGQHIALLAATPANLKALADAKPQLDAFTAAGGWVVLHGLTPEGLADFNRVVGVEHLIRKFGRERVSLPAKRSPLLSGVTLSDVVLYSSKPIFNWSAGNYVADDAYSYVVDFDDIAPFTTSPFGGYSNLVNNFVPEDGWPLIQDFELPADGSPFAIPIRLPREETILEYTHIQTLNYKPTKKLRLSFGGRDPLEMSLTPDTNPQSFTVNPPRKARDLLLEITEVGNKENSRHLAGIGNLYIKVLRSPEFYEKVRPLLNIGALVEYPRGQGGILLSQINFKESEEVPDNYTRKRSLFGTLLRNLKAPFSGERTVIASDSLDYKPVDLSKYATQFRDEKGSFGDPGRTFRDIPLGRQRLAGVLYDIYDFKTSPVPTLVMLKGPNIPGNLPEAVKNIAVGDRVDALFFLHAARVDRPRTPEEIRDRVFPEVARYTVHYADGSTLDIPMRLGWNVESYVQRSPVELPSARLALTQKASQGDMQIAAYSSQWTNPRPDVVIESVSLGYLPGIAPELRRVVPALVALTAAHSPR
jgi:hypothetical protein